MPAESISYPDDLWDEKVGPKEMIDGKKYHPMFNYLVNQVVQNYSPVVAFVGKEGKGKSMAALEAARILHEEINVMVGPFDASTNLCYDVVEFLNVIRDNVRQVVLFDEAGVNLNSKKWYSDFNRAIDESIQTMRYKSNIYMFVLPKLKDLDKSVRERIDLKVEMEKPGVAKATIYKYNFGKMDKDGKKERKTYHITRPFTPDLPPNEHREAYRQKELDFKQGNVEDWIEELIDKKRQEEQKQKQESQGSLTDLIDSGDLELG